MYELLHGVQIFYRYYVKLDLLELRTYLAVKMQRGKRQYCRNCVMVSFFAVLYESQLEEVNIKNSPFKSHSLLKIYNGRYPNEHQRWVIFGRPYLSVPFLNYYFLPLGN